MGPHRDLSESFYEILVIIFRFVVLMFFGIFRAKMMKFGWETFLTGRMYNWPGTQVGPFQDLPDSFHALPFSISRPLLPIIVGIFPAKMMKLWRTIFSNKVSVCILNAVAAITATFMILSGGNLVDGLQPASSFGPKHNCSILFLRFLWSGNFILPINTFPN